MAVPANSAYETRMDDVTQPLTAQLVCRAGEALYGEHWQMPLAKLLGVNDRTIRRLVSKVRNGEPYQVNQAWAPEIKAALQPVPREREIQARYAAEVLEALKDVG